MSNHMALVLYLYLGIYDSTYCQNGATSFLVLRLSCGKRLSATTQSETMGLDKL